MRKLCYPVRRVSEGPVRQSRRPEVERFKLLLPGQYFSVLLPERGGVRGDGGRGVTAGPSLYKILLLCRATLLILNRAATFCQCN